MYCDICGRKNECPANAECKTKPRLNAGSGLMLKKEYINFDTKACEHHGMKTDIP